MRPTIVIDDDVLIAAKAIVRQVIKASAKLCRNWCATRCDRRRQAKETVYRRCPSREPDVIVTPEIVNPLRSETP
jgi:hypothetical protein